MRHHFGGRRGRGIKTERMIDIVVYRKWQVRVGAIDRARRGKDEMLGSTMASALENVEKAGEIGVQISVRILQGVANAGLRREMHDRSELAVAENALDGPPLGKIDFVEAERVEFA